MLKEDMSRLDEQLSKITRESFGPHGTKNIIITHHEDKLYLNELEIEDPTLKCLVLAGKEQHEKFGDGVNLVISVALQHLEGAKELITEGMDPNNIMEGYRKATDEGIRILEALVDGGSESMDVMNKDQVILRIRAPVKQYDNTDLLCSLIAEACIKVCPEEPKDFNVDSVRIFTLLGECLQASHTFKGLVLNFNTVVSSIEEIQKGAKVLVIEGGVDTETITEQSIKEVAALGVKVLVSGASVAERALNYCKLYKIMVLRIASKIELDCFCRTTDAALSKLGSTVNSDHLHLGSVDSISVENGRRPRVIVKNEQGGVATVLLRAKTKPKAEELERAVVNGVNTYKALCMDSRIVPGAGATEIEIARQLKKFAMGSSYQNAIAKYAESFELIPKTLAENAFPDATTIITSVYEEHSHGNVKAGIDEEGSKDDIWDHYCTKSEALKNAAEAVYKALSFDQREHERELEHERRSRGLMSISEDYLSPVNNFIYSEERRKRLKVMTVLLRSIMPCNKDWLDIKEFDDKIYALSPDGRLYSFYKKSLILHWSTEIGGGLLLSQRSDGYFWCSDNVKEDKEDPLFLQDEVFGMVFRTKLNEERQVSTLNKAIYINPRTGHRLATPRVCFGNQVLCVNHHKMQITFYKGRIPTRRTRTSVSSYCRYSTSEIIMLTLNGERWLEKDDKHAIHSLQYRFPPGFLYKDIKWFGKVLGNDGEVVIDVNHTRGTNLLCIAQGGSSDDDVKDIVDSLDEIDRKNVNILKVYGVGAWKGVYHFMIENFGKPLSGFVKGDWELIRDDNKLVKLIKGMVSGILALHERKIAVGNLSLEDFYIDKDLNVKISPFNTQRKFPVSSSSGTSSRRRRNTANSPSFEISSSNDIKVLGHAIFYCFTDGKEYQSQVLNSLKSPPSYMSRLYNVPNALDLVKRLTNDAPNQITALQAWNHSIFWHWSMNLNFIRDIQECLELRPNNLLDIVNKLNLSKCVFAEKWDTAFPTEFLTVMNRGSYSKREPPYDYKSLFDLICLCRHLMTHEDSIRKSLKDYLKYLKQEKVRKKPPDPRVVEMFGDEVFVLSGTRRSKKRFESYFQKHFPNLVNTLQNGLRSRFEDEEDFYKYYKISP